MDETGCLQTLYLLYYMKRTRTNPVNNSSTIGYHNMLNAVLLKNFGFSCDRFQAKNILN